MKPENIIQMIAKLLDAPPRGRKATYHRIFTFTRKY